MSSARIAALHRELARVHLALAEEMAGPEDDVPAAPPPPPIKLKARRGPRLPRGVVATEEDRARVRRAGGILGE
jgi:hypothetical protein